MDKVVVTRSKLDTLAQHINAKAGTTGTLTIAQMQATVDGISMGSTPQAVEWHQCPELTRNFLASVTYDPADYSVSHIAEYAPGTAVASNYKPIGRTVGGVTYYNEAPNTATPFVNDGAYGTLKPLDRLRWINCVQAFNVRDLGGWSCDGGTVRYGLLFRGGEVTAADRGVLVGELGIRHDLNLRGSAEATWTVSPLGADVHFTKADAYNWYALDNTEAWRINLRCVFDAVTHGEPVYFHCWAGADRTGTLACVLEGLLGMSQSDIDKDYELTCFYYGTDTDTNARRRNEAEWKGLINEINAKAGTSFQDKCVTFAAELGFTAAEINAYRAAMIDGTPETVTPAISTFSVTNALSDGVTTDNAGASATQYQPYSAKIACASGKAISGVTVKMGGTDITASAWSGRETNLARKVTLSLTGCTGNNARKTVIDGQSYGLTLTAADGYTLDGATVSILMGGADVSTYYKDGSIVIPQVTGNVEITVTAVEQVAGYTNQIPLSTDAEGAVYNGGLGYKTSSRINSSHNVVELTSGTNPAFTTGRIPCQAGDVIRLKNCWIDPDGSPAEYGMNASGLNILFILSDALANASMEMFASGASNAFAENFVYDSAGNCVQFTVKRSTTTEIQFTLCGTAEQAIVTVNEEIAG